MFKCFDDHRGPRHVPNKTMGTKGGISNSESLLISSYATILMYKFEHGFWTTPNVSASSASLLRVLVLRVPGIEVKRNVRNRPKHSRIW